MYLFVKIINKKICFLKCFVNKYLPLLILPHKRSTVSSSIAGRTELPTSPTNNWRCGMSNKLTNNHFTKKFSQLDSLLSTIVPPTDSTSNSIVIAKTDSGASCHYFCDCDKDILTTNLESI